MPNLDLTFSRTVDVPKEKIWRAWTEPALLMQWFCPLPWKVVACEIDLRAGGVFSSTMQSPEGAQFPNTGCFLEIIPNQKLVWTNALLSDFRPAPATSQPSAHPHFHFTALIELRDAPQGTHYHARVLHGDEAAHQQHAAMGFEQGWGVALDQMIAMIHKGI